MVSMDEALMTHLRNELITPLSAYEKAIDKKEFRKRLKKEMGIVLDVPEDEDDNDDE